MGVSRYKTADYERRVERAREFRNNPTRTEAMEWEALRKKQIQSRKFRRQHLIGPYIVDFYCPSANLIVEIDGPIHEKQLDRDEERAHFPESTGLHCLRIPASLVEENLPAALALIRRNL